jgi:hypothetical protein
MDIGNYPSVSDNYFDMAKGEVRTIETLFKNEPDINLISAGNWFTDWE